MTSYKAYNEEGEFTGQLCPHCEMSQMAEHDDRYHCGKCDYTEEK